MEDLTTTAATVEYCANHPSVETLVRCSRCDKPICPKCMISTPVGMRCRDCAQLRRPPMYEVAGRYLWRAIGVAVGLVLVGGFIFNLLIGFAGRSIIFMGMLYLFAGGGVAELLSYVANRKRGPRLQLLAVVTVVLMTQAATLLRFALTGRLLVNPVMLIAAAIGAAVAWTRLR